MAQKRFVATIQVLLPEEIENENAACDYISEGLRETGLLVDDWSYLKLGCQFLYPVEKIVPVPYKEGDFL